MELASRISKGKHSISLLGYIYYGRKIDKSIWERLPMKIEMKNIFFMALNEVGNQLSKTFNLFPLLTNKYFINKSSSSPQNLKYN